MAATRRVADDTSGLGVVKKCKTPPVLWNKSMRSL